ncbi:glycine--tRNA ligase subunit beta [Bacillaceae bacterium]
MSHDILLEIGTEEIPARFVRGAAAQLKEKVGAWLDANRITYASIREYATPRRFAVLVSGVSEKQDDIDQEAKGPAKKIAVDEAGNWTKAALGFARGQGVSVEDLYFKEFNGAEYVFARKRQAGEPTKKLLPGLRDVITSLSFPKNMKWGSFSLRFVRPIRWIVALCDEEVIQLEIAGVSSGNKTRGHRFLGQEIVLSRPAEYARALEEQYVIADAEERKKRIVEQLKGLEREKGWVIPVDEDLLEEVTNLVEYPTVLYGRFQEEFLAIPREVLVTSMREHQRYFPVENGSGELLPFFVTVRNGDDRCLDVVARGNEKVLRARLADARFFYEEDLKLKIEDCVAKLENIVFHEELGTLGAKVRRVREIAGRLAQKLGLDPATARRIDRTAEICKFDLVTNMVYEFPELQGIMGEDYARKAGEDEGVAKGIFEHYLPRFAGDRTASTVEGAIVGISDKIDTITGCFAIGIIPTGSQDPYALRRQASGIVLTILERKLDIPLGELFDLALRGYESRGLLKRERKEVERDLREFFTLRVKSLLQEKEVRYDVIDAVLAAGVDDVKRSVALAETLMRLVGDDAFRTAVESLNRVHNLAAKAERQDVREEDFAKEVERELYHRFLAVREEARQREEQGEIAQALACLSGLQEPIDRFFEQVMVMVDDERLRANRLALLAAISAFLRSYADFTKLVMP